MEEKERVDHPILSLCIPTNGVTEWVLQVLDSIYKENPDQSCFEVVIEDNGSNEEFEKKVQEYRRTFQNIHYYKSSANGFLCQIDSFKHAQGEFIKFVNHRSRFTEGTLEYFIRFAEQNHTEKPVVFFSNGQVKSTETDSFDAFVAKLGCYSSWSGGLAFWKSDLEIIDSLPKYNALFPHTDVLFARRKAAKYLVDGREVFSDIIAGHGSKGNYNLFQAFAVEYPSIFSDMLRDGSITVETFLSVKDSMLDLLAEFYIDFIIRKKNASYSFESYDQYLQVYYSKAQLKSRIIKKLVLGGFEKFFRKIKAKLVSFRRKTESHS